MGQCDHKGSYRRETGESEYEKESQRQRCDSGSRGRSDVRPLTKGFRQPLEARKGKEMDFPLELPEGMQTCRLQF